MKEHDLKVYPEFWENLARGWKTFEIRIDDRGFDLGDTLLLREWHPITKTYTGKEVRRTVTHLLRNWRGIQSGYVIMSLEPTSTTWLKGIAELVYEDHRKEAWEEANAYIHGLPSPSAYDSTPSGGAEHAD